MKLTATDIAEFRKKYYNAYNLFAKASNSIASVKNKENPDTTLTLHELIAKIGNESVCEKNKNIGENYHICLNVHNMENYKDIILIYVLSMIDKIGTDFPDKFEITLCFENHSDITWFESKTYEILSILEPRKILLKKLCYELQ